jgi:hypothetical protein
MIQCHKFRINGGCFDLKDEKFEIEFTAFDREWLNTGRRAARHDLNSRELLAQRPAIPAKSPAVTPFLPDGIRLRGSLFLIMGWLSLALSLGTTYGKLSDEQRALLRGERMHFEGSDEWHTLKAEWIREAVQKHVALDVSNAVITGNLDLRYANIEKEVSLVDCKFEGAVDFSYAVFKQRLDLKGCEFDKGADFAYATFEYDVSLDDTDFHGDNEENGKKDASPATLASFVNAQGKGLFSIAGARTQDRVNLSFNGATLVKGVVARGSRFGGEVDFQAATIGVSSDFQETNFAKRVTFAGATIGGQALFQGATFFGDADFGLTHVTGPAFFCSATESETDSPAIFHARAIFENARIDANAEFQDVWFRGDASFDGVQVKESANFSDHVRGQKRHPVRFEKKAMFRGIDIGKVALFDGIEFRGEANFNDSHVGGASSFAHTRFAGVASFVQSRHDGTLAFDQAEFKKKIDLSGATVGGQFVVSGTLCRGPATFVKMTVGDALLQDTIFRAPVDFAFTHFKADAVFGNAHFLDRLDFQKTVVDGDLMMVAAHFEREAQFTLSSVAGTANFSGAVFEGPAYFGSIRAALGGAFAGTKFCNRVAFNGARFLSLATFEDVLFFKEVSFQETLFNYVEFQSARQEPVKHRAQFFGPVDLRGCVYDRMTADWPNMMAQLQPYDRGPYTQLEKVLVAAGQSQQADNVYLARQRAELAELWKQKHYGSWLFALLYGWIANYGVRPYRLLVFSAALLLLGTYFFRKADRVITEDDEPIPSTYAWNAWDGFRLSFRYFLPVPIAMGSSWKANDKPVNVPFRFLFGREPRLRPTAFATILQIAGWILVPLGLAALTGLLRIKG